LNEDEPVEVSSIRYDSLSINVTNGGPQQNTSLRQDVNNDGSVSTIDALVIINAMGRETFAAEGESIVATRYFTDVKGDQRLSAVDALQVINFLRRTYTGAEGELVAQQLPSNATDLTSESTVSSDDVFADLDDGDNVGWSGDSVSQATLPFVAGSDADDDRDDDDLDLLANDVATLWG
jgi:hypothetical protein